MLRGFFTRLRGLFHDDARIDEEMAAHLEMLAAEYESRGLTPHQARLAARRAFGGVAQVRESWREQRGLPFFEWLLQDLRYARGQIRKHPGFTATAILTLALGIGANAVVYQVLDAVIYRPLPVRAPQQLELLKITEDGKATVGVGVGQDFSYPVFHDLAARQNVAEAVFAASFSTVRAGQSASDEKLAVSLVSGNYFSGLGAGVALGRVLTPADDRPGAPPVAVIGYPFWDRHYGRRPDAIGKSLRVGKTTVTVVGVAPAGFYGTMLGFPVDAWLPAALQPRVMQSDWLGDRNTTWLNVMARLKPGVSPQRAHAALDALYHGQTGTEHHHLIVSPGYRGIPVMQGNAEAPGLACMALVAVVLLIACCNLANLVLGRGTARAHEIGVRVALGAARRRIVRQLFTESLLLAAAGCAVGVGLAAWAWPELSRDLELPFFATHLSWHTVLFAAIVALLATCLFGLAPALAATRGDVLTALQANRRILSAGRSSHRLGRLLVGAQIAVSVLMIYSAGLLARSLWNLEHRDPGFRTEGLLAATFSWDLDAETTDRAGREDALAQPLYDRLNRVPGVVGAAVCAFGPLSNSTETGPLSTPERPSPDENSVLGVHVSPRYFETMGTAIVRGRGITEADRANTRHVAVLSETAARRLFGGANPIGRLVSHDTNFDQKEADEVVGVARDVVFSGLRDDAPAVYYVPLAQAPALVTSVLVRTAGNPDAAIGAVRAALHEVAPGREVAKIEPVSETLDDALGTDQLLAFSSSGFGLLALALTALGIYGVIAYAMAGRTREIGIRLALGASPSNVSQLVAREYIWLIAASAAVGGATGIAAARLIRGMLFGVATDDYILLSGAAAILAAVAAFAGWLPARRAARLDPMVALREE